jgi:hypothetical protein
MTTTPLDYQMALQRQTAVSVWPPFPFDARRSYAVKVCLNHACSFLEEFGEIAEYRDEITLCADCQTPLVDRALAPTFPLSAKANAQAADAETLVVIATFDHPLQGYLHRARLEAEGIPAFLFDKQMVTNNWLMTKALGACGWLCRKAPRKLRW